MVPPLGDGGERGREGSGAGWGGRRRGRPARRTGRERSSGSPGGVVCRRGEEGRAARSGGVTAAAGAGGCRGLTAGAEAPLGLLAPGDRWARAARRGCGGSASRGGRPAPAPPRGRRRGLLCEQGLGPCRPVGAGPPSSGSRGPAGPAARGGGGARAVAGQRPLGGSPLGQTLGQRREEKCGRVAFAQRCRIMITSRGCCIFKTVVWFGWVQLLHLALLCTCRALLRLFLAEFLTQVG